MRKLVSLVFGLAALAALGFGSDGKETLKRIWQLYSEEHRLAQQENRASDQEKILAEARKIAVEALKDFDESKVTVDDLITWGQIATFAGEYQLGIRLFRRFIEDPPPGANLFEPNMFVIALSARAKDWETLEEALESYRPATLRDTEQYVSYLFDDVIDRLIEAKAFEQAIRAIDRAERFILADLTVAQKQLPLDGGSLDAKLSSARKDALATRVRVMVAEGKRSQARALLVEGTRNESLFPWDRESLSALVRQIDLIGSAAPKLTARYTIGNFAGLQESKGKVVVLYSSDWEWRQMWVDLRAIQEKMGGENVQVVGVVRLRGFITVKDASEQEEIDHVRQLAADAKLTSPIVVATDDALKEFGILRQRTVMVIDREGKVRGFFSQQPLPTDAIRRLVESLL